MKYLIVLALLLVVVWLWRSNRRSDRNDHQAADPTRPRPAPRLATEVVACDLCHVHLPRSEALTGPGGVYCCDAHRRQAGN